MGYMSSLSLERLLSETLVFGSILPSSNVLCSEYSHSGVEFTHLVFQLIGRNVEIVRESWFRHRRPPLLDQISLSQGDLKGITKMIEDIDENCIVSRLWMCALIVKLSSTVAIPTELRLEVRATLDEATEMGEMLVEMISDADFSGIIDEFVYWVDRVARGEGRVEEAGVSLQHLFECVPTLRRKGKFSDAPDGEFNHA